MANADDWQTTVVLVDNAYCGGAIKFRPIFDRGPKIPNGTILRRADAAVIICEYCDPVAGKVTRKVSVTRCGDSSARI